MRATIINTPRTYVLDTNVLIHDPTAPFNFDEHTVVLPLAVLEEMDGMKQGQSDRARQAREATRLLDRLMESQPATTHHSRSSIELPASVSDGVPGVLRFLSPEERLHEGLDMQTKDNQILAVALDLHLAAINRPGDTGAVILVTNDINMRVKAAAVGVRAEGYRTDAVFTDSDAMSDGVWSTDTPAAFWESFDAAGPAHSPEGESSHELYTFKGKPVESWHPGMFIVDGDGFEARVEAISEGVARARITRNFYNSQAIWGVTARNQLQNLALNLLLDNDMDLVTLAGPAGTGKTFLALAAALYQVFDLRLFERLIITRETVAMGEDIGFLPGGEEEKMAPWMGAFMDNIEQLVAAGSEGKTEAGMELIKRRLQMRSLGLMRGRSFANSILIVDEAQNLSPKQIKNLITRAGKNTKIICLGNVAQIDTPYLNAGSTGLANLVQKFRGWEHAGHVTLTEVERSRLAAQAEILL